MSDMTQKGYSPAAIGALARGDIENFFVASTPGGIEAQEKRGQLEQAKLQTLPIQGTIKHRMGHRDEPGPKAVFEKLGFVFGKEADDLFVECTFPKGWSKKPSDHSMWSHIIDDKGRERGGIFYKAAFYDRSAHVDLNWRFHVRRDYDAKPKARIYVEDANKSVVRSVEGLECPDYNGPRDKADAAHCALAAAEGQLERWLNENYPEWQTPTAYWD